MARTWRPTRRIVPGRSVRSAGVEVNLANGFTSGGAYITPDITSIAENAKYMRAALLANIAKKLEPAALEVQAKIRHEAPWKDQSSEFHTAARGYPNANARKNLFAVAFSNPSSDIVGIQVGHSAKTVYTGSSSGKFYYGNVLENGRKKRRDARNSFDENDRPHKFEDEYHQYKENQDWRAEQEAKNNGGAMEGSHYLARVMRNDLEPIVMRYLAGRALEGITFAGAKAPPKAPAKPKANVRVFKGLPSS